MGVLVSSWSSPRSFRCWRTDEGEDLRPCGEPSAYSGIGLNYPSSCLRERRQRRRRSCHWSRKLISREHDVSIRTLHEWGPPSLSTQPKHARTHTRTHTHTHTFTHSTHYTHARTHTTHNTHHTTTQHTHTHARTSGSVWSTHPGLYELTNITTLMVFPTSRRRRPVYRARSAGCLERGSQALAGGVDRRVVLIIAPTSWCSLLTLAPVSTVVSGVGVTSGMALQTCGGSWPWS